MFSAVLRGEGAPTLRYGLQGETVGAHRWRLVGADVETGGADAVGVVFNLSATHRVAAVVNGRAIDLDPPAVGSLTLLPPGETASFQVRGESDVVRLRLAALHLRSVAEAAFDLDPESVALVPRLHVRDRVVERLMLGLTHRIATGQADALFREEFAQALAGQLVLAHATRLPPARARAVYGLTRRQIGAVQALVEARLAAPLRLADLADAAGLSPFHFSRQFKRSLGMSPWRWVMDRRLERAKDFLAAGRLTLEETAARTGFAGRTQLSREFARSYGIPPAALRALLR